MTPTELLDKRNPRELNEIRLPPKLNSKIKRLRRREAVQQPDLAAAATVNNGAPKDMLSIVKDFQLHKFENEKKVRSALGHKLEKFAERMDLNMKFELADRLQDKIKQITRRYLPSRTKPSDTHRIGHTDPF